MFGTLLLLFEYALKNCFHKINIFERLSLFYQLFDNDNAFAKTIIRIVLILRTIGCYCSV